MDKFTKFFKQLTKKDRKKVQMILEKLLSNNIGDLKFEKLKTFKGLYRIRIGKIRIVCRKDGEIFYPINVDYRKNIYKEL